MIPVQADFIDLPASVQDGKYGKLIPEPVVVTTYVGSSESRMLQHDDSTYIVPCINESPSSILRNKDLNLSSVVSSTWEELQNSPDELYAGLLPSKSFKMKVKIKTVNKKLPKFSLD